MKALPDELAVLVVEDEYLLADELCTELRSHGVRCLGPVATLQAALMLVRSEVRIDAAIVDINLGSEPACPLIDLLLNRCVPLLLFTGYDPSTIPARYMHIARCEKPVDLPKVVQQLARIVTNQTSGSAAEH